MKKFDFSKEFGNIDPKYIEEAEREWSEKKENRRPKGWSKAAAACVIVTLGSVIFSNPHIQAAIKNITLSIGETLGFPKSIESYRNSILQIVHKCSIFLHKFSIFKIFKLK